MHEKTCPTNVGRVGFLRGKSAENTGGQIRLSNGGQPSQLLHKLDPAGVSQQLAVGSHGLDNVLLPIDFLHDLTSKIGV